jgi:hypothetical protein
VQAVPLAASAAQAVSPLSQPVFAHFQGRHLRHIYLDVTVQDLHAMQG